MIIPQRIDASNLNAVGLSVLTDSICSVDSLRAFRFPTFFSTVLLTFKVSRLVSFPKVNMQNSNKISLQHGLQPKASCLCLCAGISVYALSQHASPLSAMHLRRMQTAGFIDVRYRCVLCHCVWLCQRDAFKHPPLRRAGGVYSFCPWSF